MSGERLPQAGHKGPELADEAAERAKELSKGLEHSAEHDRTKEKAEAQAEVSEVFKQAEHQASGSEKESPASHRIHVGKKQRSHSFNSTIKQVQSELPPVARAFSKFVHNPVVEKTSGFIGATVARPDAIIGGSLCAFISVLVLYITASYFGFSLTGFEPIGAFILGWLIGLAIDLVKRISKS